MWHENESPPDNVVLICQGERGAYFTGIHENGEWKVFPCRTKRKAARWMRLPEFDWISATLKPNPHQIVLVEGTKGAIRIGYHDGVIWRTNKNVPISVKQWHKIEV